MTESGSPLPLLSRYAIMVDVGYIYASTGELLFSAASRREYRVDADKLIQALSRQAEDQVRGELLRIYWYDAARDRVPTIDQRVIAQMPWVKLRLGNLNARGQQKGVDAQIRADMEGLARHRAITDAILVAGDEDMVPAVEAAQAYGVRVHLWGIEPPYGTNQAERLVWESDTVDVLERAFVEPFFTRQLVTESGSASAAQAKAAAAAAAVSVPGSATAPSPAQVFGERHFPKAPARPVPLAVAVSHLPAARLGPDRERVEEAGEHVAQKWILTRGEDNIRDLLPGPILPPVIDKELLVEAEKELGLSLRAYQEAREWLRDAFWARVHREFGIGVKVEGMTAVPDNHDEHGTALTLAVTAGQPTAEELAAVVVALTAAGPDTGPGASADPSWRAGTALGRRSPWSAAAALMTQAPAAGPGAWRRSTLPH